MVRHSWGRTLQPLERDNSAREAATRRVGYIVRYALWSIFYSLGGYEVHGARLWVVMAVLQKAILNTQEKDRR
jgi:hypothetical protein